MSATPQRSLDSPPRPKEFGGLQPTTLLELHERLRRNGVPVASILVARTIGEARAFWSTWMRGLQRRLIVAPEADSGLGLAAWKARTTGSPNDMPGLLFAGPTRNALEAAVNAARVAPSISVAAIASTDALAVEFSSSTMPALLLGDLLKGLIPLSPEDGRILDVVASRPAMGPLLRSAFEGVLFYLLEARRETQGRFKSNQRITRPGGDGTDEVDLVAENAKLVIEVDGAQHTTWEHTRRDQEKDARLRSIGYEILRFDAKVVATQPSEVWEKINLVLRRRGTS
jgi:very-short-patch-repair endonuclease